jgi:anti-anti-sigma factor
MARTARFRIDQVADRIYALEGDFDLDQVHRFAAALRLDVARPGELLLNLEELNFIDSTAIGAVLAVARQLQGDLILFKPPWRIQRVFDLVGIRKAPNIRITEDGKPQGAGVVPSADSRSPDVNETP